MIFKKVFLKHKETKVGAGFVLYENAPRPRVLCLLKHSGELDLPKGHSSPNDINLFFTAQRECFEEVCIFVKMNDLLTREVYTDEDLTIFCAVTDQKPEIGTNPVTNKIEHAGYIWLEPSNAIELLPDHLSQAVVWSLQFVSNT